MNRTLSILVLASTLIIGCDKETEMGEVLFCTNSGILNCPFSIEISIDNNIADTLTAASEYTSMKCACPELDNIGILIDAEAGEHTFYAKELDCIGVNRVNEWSGNFEITANSCQVINLNISEMIVWP